MTRKTKQTDEHALRPDILHEINQLLFLKGHHQAILQTIEQQMVTLLKTATGVDINQGQWHLDLDKGVLRRDDQSPINSA